MKKSINLLSLVLLGFTLFMTSCNKDELLDATSNTGLYDDIAQIILPSSSYTTNITTALEMSENYDYYTKGVIEYILNGEVLATVDFGDGSLDEYASCKMNGSKKHIHLHGGKDSMGLTQKIIKPLVRTKDCDFIVEGIIKLYKDTTWIATIDFGDGTCDEWATKTTKDGTTKFSLKKKAKGPKDCDCHKPKRHCFKLVFPLEIKLLSTNSTVKVYDIKELDSLRKVDSFTFVFPISVLTKDSTTVSLSSQYDLDTMIQNCPKFKPQAKGPCFEFVFPISVIYDDSSTATAYSHEDMIKLKKDGKFKLVFPITIKTPDNKTVKINDASEFEALMKKCKDRGGKEGKKDKGNNKDKKQGGKKGGKTGGKTGSNG